MDPCSKNYILLKEEQWKRLKRQAAPEEIDTKPIEDAERTKKLLELSRNWMRNWPDTELGHVTLLKKQLKEEHEKEVSKLLEFSHKKKTDNSKEVIKKARQKIFDRSCYGQQLKSAYLESRAIEEREAQIQFKKEIDEKKREKDIADEIKNTLILRSDGLSEEERKVRNKQNAEINRIMHKLNQEQSKKEKEHERLMQLEDTRLTQALLKLEQEPDIKCKNFELQAAKEVEDLQLKIKEEREKREQLDETLAAVSRKYQDRIRLKEKQMCDKMHMDKHSTDGAKKHYQLIQTLQDEETRKYNDFVEKGITVLEQRDLEKQQKETAKQEKERRELNLTNSQNKKLEDIKFANRLVSTKCTCEKQSLFTTQCADKMKKQSRVEDSANVQKPYKYDDKQTKLQELRHRETIPSPWTGTTGAHTQFAQAADEILAICRHKTMARKVVDNYRKEHDFNSSTLPVPNY